MKLDANSGMNLLAKHFIAEPIFIVFVHLDRSKTPAQLHIMKWNPDEFG